MTHLVDTDVVIQWLRSEQRAIVLLQSLPYDALAMSVITFGEVYEGIYFGRNPAQAERVFRAFRRGLRILDVNRSVAREYARITGALRKQGQLIPQPDMLIAATALTYNLTLLTYNRRHFNRVAGLTIAP